MPGEGENKRKPHSPVREGPESPHAQAAHHVCHSCGWTFPNPHPSAKQRRAHRKHCGKIDGFSLVSPHGDDNGNNYGDCSAATSAHGEDPSDADPHQQKMPISSLGAVETLATEGGDVEESCGTKEGMKTLVSIGFHGDDAVVISEENADLPSESTAASADGMPLSASDAIDILQGFDMEAPPDVKAKRSGGLDESSFVKRAVSGEQCVADGSQLSIEMESIQGPRQSNSCTSNGLFPSETQVARESQERKKKEEIIAKVESWSSGKQHTPLRTLLVEANHESKHKTQNPPLHKMPLRSNRSQAPLVEGFTTGIPAPISEHLTETSARKEVQKEWNSPARLPINKNERRRAKGKPQWVPFLCCPSLN